MSEITFEALEHAHHGGNGGHQCGQRAPHLASPLVGLFQAALIISFLPLASASPLPSVAFVDVDVVPMDRGLSKTAYQAIVSEARQQLW